MAYRKTEKVLAQLEAKRNSLIAASIDVIEKVGLDGLTTDGVCERAGVAAGLLYRYFPDKTELLAAVVAHWLERDLAAMKEASNTDGLRGAVSALASRWVINYRIISQIGRFPAYREGIRREIQRLIGDNSKRSSIQAAAVFGALIECCGLDGMTNQKNERTLIVSLLRVLQIDAEQLKEPSRS